jgi:hypothetical protein
MGTKPREPVMQKYAKQLLAKKKDVGLCYNDEAGIRQWSVFSLLDEGYWIDSFKTKIAAENFCRKNNLSIVATTKYISNQIVQP